VPSARSPAALLSLSDRSGLAPLAGALRRHGYRLIATAGTAAAIREIGIACEEVGELTGYPPLLDGRVKTLHPKVLAGILADLSVPDHIAELERFEIPAISIVAVNLYPFEQTMARADATPAEIVEQIDIGGVTLLRAAAKNSANVSVLSSPDQYEAFADGLERGGPTPQQRRRWAAAAFAACERYDAANAAYFKGADKPARVTRLRYGENPWARAEFQHGADGGVQLPQQLSGRELSYNNMLDLDSCLRLLARPDPPRDFPHEALSRRAVVAAIVKHTVPCGLAARDSAPDALAEALGADPISAFGGIVACNAPMDVAAARLIAARFLEVSAAPAYSAEALELLGAKKNLRVLQFDPSLPARLMNAPKARSALGGLLVEEPDPKAAPDEWTVVTPQRPSVEQWRDLLFAFGAVRFVKSNAALVARDESAIGVCGGQTNRVSAVELACRRAGPAVRGAVLATDGFFPFADGVEAAGRAGIAAVVAPKGSIRDQEVIDAARKSGIALVFTTRRYFLH